jgi:hypothetical protein
MVWAGTLSLPIFALKLLIVPQFGVDLQSVSLYLPLLISALIFGFTFGGIAAVTFEIFFHQKLNTVAHPHRIHLNWLIFGPIVFALGILLLKLPFANAISLGFFIQALILIILRKDLLWDAVISGVFIGLMYVLFYYLFFTVIPGQLNTLWFSDLSGISLFGLPVEEIVAIFTFGLLWGPIYEGTKGYKLRDEK